MTTGRIVMFSNVRVIRLIKNVEKLENSEKFYARLLTFNDFFRTLATLDALIAHTLHDQLYSKPTQT